MNTRAKRLILPLGGTLVASSVIGVSMAGTADAAPERKTFSLAASAADAKAIAGDWTAGKLKKAKSYREDSTATGRRKSSAKASADGKPGVVAPTGTGVSAGRSRNVNLPTTVGRVFFEVDGKPYYCSGSAVQSKYRNLVATAGHCVYDTDKNKPVDNFVFIPGYYQGKAPWGIYVGAKLHTHYDFNVYEDYDKDYAFVNVYNGIKQAGYKTVDKKTFDAHKGPKLSKDIEITQAEYQKCRDEHGGETPDCWAKITKIEDPVGPSYPGAVVVLKEVSKEEYDKAPSGRKSGAKATRVSGVAEHVTKSEYDAYKGPGYKKIDRHGNYTITHYFLKYWVKKSSKVNYFKTVFQIRVLTDAGRLSDNVGGQGFAWNQKLYKKVFVFGYPTAPHPDGNKAYTGETMKWCYGKTYPAPAVSKYNVQEDVAVKCAFTPGSSGGPLVWMYKSAKRTGYINGVVSITLDTDGNSRYDRIASPYFDGDTAGIYKYAANLWTGRLGG